MWSPIRTLRLFPGLGEQLNVHPDVFRTPAAGPGSWVEGRPVLSRGRHTKPSCLRRRLEHITGFPGSLGTYLSRGWRAGCRHAPEGPVMSIVTGRYVRDGSHEL
jgi:hypothetical protein